MAKEERLCDVCKRILPPRRKKKRCAECSGEILVYRNPGFTVVTDAKGRIVSIERKP